MARPKQIIFETLEDLGEDEFKKFKWFLQDFDKLEGFRPIRMSRLEKADRMETVDLMVQTYGEKMITVTRRILVEMNHNDLVERLSDNISQPQPTGSRWQTPQRKPEDGGPAEDRVPAVDRVPAEKRLLSVRKEFVKRVSEPVLNQLMDELLQRDVITDNEQESIRSVRVRAERARDLIDIVRGKGNAASSDLIAALCEVDRHLYRELNFS